MAISHVAAREVILYMDKAGVERCCDLVQDCFELGVILLRKKLYTQATKNLEKASRMWDGEPEELAQACHCHSPIPKSLP